MRHYWGIVYSTFVCLFVGLKREFKMIIDAKIIKAILLAAAKKDIRHSLNGLMVNDRHIVATDGARMHAYKHGEEWGHGEVIIPVDKVELALKMKTKQIKIGKDNINGIPFDAIDSKFPDYSRVIPQAPKPTEGEIVASIDPEFLLDACKAIKVIAYTEHYPVFANVGNNTWVWSNEYFIAVIMGVNMTAVPPNLETFR